MGRRDYYLLLKFENHRASNQYLPRALDVETCYSYTRSFHGIELVRSQTILLGYGILKQRGLRRVWLRWQHIAKAFRRLCCSMWSTLVKKDLNVDTKLLGFMIICLFLNWLSCCFEKLNKRFSESYYGCIQGKCFDHIT